MNLFMLTYPACTSLFICNGILVIQSHKVKVDSFKAQNSRNFHELQITTIKCILKTKKLLIKYHAFFAFQTGEPRVAFLEYMYFSFQGEDKCTKLVK